MLTLIKFGKDIKTPGILDLIFLSNFGIVNNMKVAHRRD
jgi:hypothetical protein